MGRRRENDELAFLSQQVEAFKKLREPSIQLILKARGAISKGKDRIGIFPASFNPPTLAHLALIKEARSRDHLHEIVLVLDIHPKDKKRVGAALGDRLYLLKKLFRRDPQISIGLSNRGLFVEKLRPLTSLYPPGVTYVFVVGLDTISRVMDRRYYENRDRSLEVLFSHCRFFVASRGDRSKEAFENLFKREGNERFRHHVSFAVLARKFSFISSSLVRRRIRKGQSIEGFVPLEVQRFIQMKRLYLTRSLSRST